MILTMFELTFGKFSMARKPIINGGAIRPTCLLLCFVKVLFMVAYTFCIHSKFESKCNTIHMCIMMLPGNRYGIGNSNY